MQPNPDLVRGTLNTLILESVADRPRYGYEICKLVQQRSGGYLSMREGSLYPALHRMERAGWLRSSWQDAAGRRRKYYQITAKGARQLSSLKDEWRNFAGAVSALLTPSGRRVRTEGDLA